MFYICGNNCCIQDNAIVGFKYTDGCKEVHIGNDATIRAFTIIYADVTIGDNFQTGHHVVIREKTTFGNKIVVGSGSIIDGYTTIGNEVKIESQVYIPTNVTIGNNVFIGPGATLTNDRYPQRLRDEYVPEGPILEDGVTVGANVVIVPGVRVGKGSFLAAGSIVSKDVPPWSLVKGSSGEILPLPEKLKELNKAKKW